MATVFRVWLSVYARETYQDQFTVCMFYAHFCSWYRSFLSRLSCGQVGMSISKWATMYSSEPCPVSRPPPECDLFLIMKWTNWTWQRMPHHSWEVDDWIIGHRTVRDKKGSMTPSSFNYRDLQTSPTVSHEATTPNIFIESVIACIHPTFSEAAIWLKLPKI